MTAPGTWPRGASGQLEQCNKCALCQEVCPAYAASGREADGARGRNRLIRLFAAGELSGGEQRELQASLATCLLCGACTAACPAGVPTSDLVAAARAALLPGAPLPVLARFALDDVLLSPRRLHRWLSAVLLAESAGLRRAATLGGRVQLPGLLGRAERLLPPLPRRPFTAAIASLEAQVRLAAAGYTVPTHGRRVVLFAGCLTDNIFPEVAAALYGVLRLNGFEVIVPEIACCGAAHEAYGDRAAWARLARTNVDALGAATAGAEAIITDCATCAHSLSRYASLLADDPAYAAPAASLSQMVREACQFLAAQTLLPPLGRLTGAVTYHDPCHLAYGLDSREEPRALLRLVPGLELRELPDSGSCCGGAGSYALTQPEISGAILAGKLSQFAATGAQWLATACPACLLQLRAGLRRSMGGTAESSAVHPAELLWRAYRSAGPLAPLPLRRAGPNP